MPYLVWLPMVRWVDRAAGTMVRRSVVWGSIMWGTVVWRAVVRRVIVVFEAVVEVVALSLHPGCQTVLSFFRGLESAVKDTLGALVHCVPDALRGLLNFRIVLLDDREDLVLFLHSVIVEAVATVIDLNGDGVESLLGREHKGGTHSRERQDVGDSHDDLGVECDGKERGFGK